MHRLLLAVIATAFATAAFAAESETKPVAPVTLLLYELRAIQAGPGKLDALHGRLRDHQIPLLKEHGIFTQAVFVPAGENPHELVYLLTAAEGLGPMEEGWTGFRKDPKWLKISEETGSDGNTRVTLCKTSRGIMYVANDGYNSEWHGSFNSFDDAIRHADSRVFGG
jgi:hypothetical protein